MMAMILDVPRVLVCGSRRWSWPMTVGAVLDRLAARYGERLVVIEGAASGADRAAHDWCSARGLDAKRHRCFPVDWTGERERRPADWRLAGPERNVRILVEEQPRLIVAFHDRFEAASGGTSDMCLRGLLKGVPAWLVPGEDADAGHWLRLGMFPQSRADRCRRELGIGAPGPDLPTLFDARQD
jgi:hypothetical protein